MSKIWKWQEIQFIENNAHALNDKELTQELIAKFQRHFTAGAVRKMRQRIGVKKEDCYRGHFKVTK